MVKGLHQEVNCIGLESKLNSKSLLVSTGTDVLEEYKEMISNTTSDLEDHLQEIERKLKYLPLQVTILDEDVVERDQMRVERESTMQCLVICAQVSKQVNQLQPNVFEDLIVAKGSHQADVARLGGLISAKQVTASTLQELQEKLTNTTSHLEQQLQDIDNRLRSLLSPGSRIVGGDERDQVQAVEEESIKQCLAICAQASEQADQFRINVFEDVFAAKDAHQLIGATLGDLISAKQVTAELVATRWPGYMSDADIRHISRDRALRGRRAIDRFVESVLVKDLQTSNPAGSKLISRIYFGVCGWPSVDLSRGALCNPFDDPFRQPFTI